MTAPAPAAAVAETRQAIIAAASDLLQRVGYSSFSFRDLGEVVGIRSASIHYHFPTKADLGLALIEWYSVHTDERERDLVAAHRDPRARLLALAESICERTGGGRSCPLAMLQAEIGVLPEHLQLALKALIDKKFAVLTRWLEEGRKAKRLRFPGDARTQARLVWAVIEYGTQLARSHDERSLPALMRQLVETMSS